MKCIQMGKGRLTALVKVKTPYTLAEKGDKVDVF